MRRFAVAVLFGAQWSCAATLVGPLTATTSSGASDRATLSIGAQSYHVDDCRSGDREYFLGVDLWDRAEHAVVRLVIDPVEGLRLRVTRGAGSAREQSVFDLSQCRQLQADVRPTGWRVNQVRDFSGSLDAECTSSSGLPLSAHVRFEHCH